MEKAQANQNKETDEGSEEIPDCHGTECGICKGCQEQYWQQKEEEKYIRENLM